MADLGWLSFRQTPFGRGPFSPTPLACRRLRLRRTVTSSFESRENAARWVRLAPWRTNRPPTGHARAGGLGVAVLRGKRGARGTFTPCGRGFTSPTPLVGRRLRRRYITAEASVSLGARPRPLFTSWGTGRRPAEHRRTNATADPPRARGARTPSAPSRPEPRASRAACVCTPARGARPTRDGKRRTATGPWPRSN